MVNYDAIKYAIEMDDIECLHQLFQAILKDKSIIEFDNLNDSYYGTDENDSIFDKERDSSVNLKIKQFQRDALNLARKSDRSTIELYLSLSPSKFESVEGKEFIERLHQIIFTNVRLLIEKLNDNDFISLFFSNKSKFLRRARQNQNLSQFQSLNLNQKSPKRKSNSVSFSSGSHRSESDDLYYSKPNYLNDYSASYNPDDYEENESQSSPKLNSLFVFTNKIFASTHNLNLYFRFLNIKNKALKNELKEIENKSKSGDNDEISEEIIDMWANQLKKTNDVLKQLDNDVISPSSIDSISKWMTVVQKRKEFIENLLNRQIDEGVTSSIIEDKKSQINSVLQATRRYAKMREDYEIISKLASSFNNFVAKCRSSMPHPSPKFDELVDLISKDIVALPQSLPTRTNRQPRGRISTNITQIITDKDKL